MSAVIGGAVGSEQRARMSADLGISHIRSPERSGKVERSHHTEQDELCTRVPIA